MVLSEDPLGQRLQAALFRRSGPGLPLGPEGKVNVLQPGQGICCQQLLLQISCEQLALGQGMKDGVSSLFELSDSEEKITYPGNCDLIQISCGLFSVSGNEGQRCAAVQQLYGGLDLSLAQGQLQSHFFNLRIGHIASFLECRDQKDSGFLIHAWAMTARNF